MTQIVLKAPLNPNQINRSSLYCYLLPRP